MTTFSERVKQRDEHCLICHSKKQLEAHHLFSKSRYPLLKGKVKNGVTLCREHHQRFHTKYGGDRSGFDFIEWLYQDFLGRSRLRVSNKIIKQLFDVVLGLYRLLEYEKESDSHIEQPLNGDVQIWMSQQECATTSEITKETLGTLQKMYDPIHGEFEPNVLLHIGFPRTDYELFNRYCNGLNITTEQGIYCLVQNELNQAFLKAEERGKKKVLQLIQNRSILEINLNE